MTEIALCLVSAASTMAAIETGHWFATPFAMLFTSGYGYVAFFVASEQLARKSAQSARAPTETSMAHAPGLATPGESSPPPASADASGSPERTPSAAERKGRRGPRAAPLAVVFPP